MNTMVVNCYAGPGAGKTTCAWEVASQLKKKGINTEYVSEYAKELVWEEKYDVLENQEHLFAEQAKRLERLRGKVEVIVTDSPILMSHIYGRNNSTDFTMRIDDEYKKYYNFNLFIKRGDTFQQAGRIQNLEESKALDRKIMNMLKEKNIYFGVYSHENIKYISDNIIKNLQAVREKPEIERITVKVIPDNQTRIMALESGEIDLIFGKNMLDADAISQYVDSDKFEVALSDPTSTRHIVLNTTNEILSDTAVRQALQHATNRTAISEGIFYGLEQPADTLYAATVPYCDVELTPYEYSTETASSMLDEAGWIMGSSGIREKGGKKLELDLLYNSDSVTEKTISEYLQSEYLKLGISLNIHGEEEQSYRDNMKAGNFDMVFNICWGMPYDPQSSLAAMRAPVYGDFAAQQGLADKKEIDQAITDILTTTDEEERQELYRFVLTRLHEDAVYIPLTFECNKALYTKNLQGVHFGTDQYDVPFSDMYFE